MYKQPALIWTTVVFTIIASLLRLTRLSTTSLWNDEFFTIFFAQQSLGRSFELMLIDAVHAPAYFVLMRPFADSGDLVARIPAVFFGIISIPLTITITHQLLRNQQLALWAGALVMVNPLHIWMSRMTRPYTMFYVMGLLTIYLFFKLLRGKRSIAMWMLFFFISTITYLTHYFSVFIPMAQLLLMMIVLRNDAMFLRIWLIVQMVAGLPLLGWIIALSQQEGLSFGIGWIPDPALYDIIVTPISIITGYHSLSTWYLLPLGLLAIMGIALAIRNLWQAPRQHTVLLYAWLLVFPSVIFVFVLALNFINAFVDRYFIILLPTMIWLFVTGWQKTLAPRHFSIVMLVMMLGTGLFSTVTIFNNDAEREDWIGVWEMIDSRYQSGDAVLIEPEVGLLPLRRYADGHIDEANIIHIQNAESDTLDQTYARVWVVFRNPNTNIHREFTAADFDVFDTTRPLTKWLQDRHNNIDQTYEFNGVKVLLITFTQ